MAWTFYELVETLKDDMINLKNMTWSINKTHFVGWQKDSIAEEFKN